MRSALRPAAHAGLVLMDSDHDRVRQHARQEMSANTARAYRSAMRGLLAWLAERGYGTELPLAPLAVVAYIAWRADHGASRSLINTVAAAVAHPHDVAKLAWAGPLDADYRRARQGSSKKAARLPRHAAPLRPEMLRAIIEHGLMPD